MPLLVITHRALGNLAKKENFFNVAVKHDREGKERMTAYIDKVNYRRGKEGYHHISSLAS